MDAFLASPSTGVVPRCAALDRALDGREVPWTRAWRSPRRPAATSTRCARRRRAAPPARWATSSPTSSTGTSTSRTSASSTAPSAPSAATTARRRATSSRSRRWSAGRARPGSSGATEVCIQAGLPPKLDGRFYIDLCRAIHDALPDLHIHAFSPEEVLYGVDAVRCRSPSISAS